MTDRPVQSADVITLAQAASRFPAVDLVLRHWEALRGGRSMPARDDIDPRALAQALENLFIAEPVAPTVARIRLAGQHLTQLLGMEPRGMPLCALFEGPAARAEIGQAIEQVTRHGARVILPLRAAGGIGRPALEGLLALMPVSTGDGRPTRVLGVLQTRGAIGRTPRPLGLSGPAERIVATRPAPSAGRRPQLQVIPGGIA